MAGGAPAALTLAKATCALRGFRARTGPDRVRFELAKKLIGDVRRYDEQLAVNGKKITALLDEHGTRLVEIDGFGPVLAARPARPHRPDAQVLFGSSVRELHRHGARPDRQR